MPGIIDYLKDWEPKKHGWPVLIIIVLFGTWELLSPDFVPKDPSCMQEVKFLQTELTEDRRWKDSAINYKIMLSRTVEDSRKKDTIIKAYHEVTIPYTHVLKKK